MVSLPSLDRADLLLSSFVGSLVVVLMVLSGAKSRAYEEREDGDEADKPSPHTAGWSGAVYLCAFLAATVLAYGALRWSKSWRVKTQAADTATGEKREISGGAKAPDMSELMQYVNDEPAPF